MPVTPQKDTDDIERVGRAIYGDRQWMAHLSRDLGLDSATVKKWMSGERKISDRAWSDMVELLENRAKRCLETAELMKEERDIPQEER